MSENEFKFPELVLVVPRNKVRWAVHKRRQKKLSRQYRNNHRKGSFSKKKKKRSKYSLILSGYSLVQREFSRVVESPRIRENHL